MTEPVQIQEILYAIIITSLLIALVFSLKAYIKRLRLKFFGKKKEKAPKVEFETKRKTVYPFTAIILVKELNCGGCAKEVENALNSLDGLWASANPKTHRVTVRMKKSLDEKILSDAIKNATDCEVESIVFKKTEI